MIFARTKKEYNLLVDALEASTGPLAFDTETEAFDDPDDVRPWELPIIGAGFWAEGVCGYTRGEFLDERFQKLIDTRSIVMHNAQFDMSVIEGAGFDVSKMHVDDTLIMSALVNENRQTHGLKALAKSVLDVKEVTLLKDVGLEAPPKGTPEYDEWETKLGTYCVDDARYTFELFHDFKPRLEKDGLWRLYDELERPLIDILRRMTRRGIKIDVPYLEDMRGRLSAEIKTTKKAAVALWRDDKNDQSLEPNIGSTPQLREYFFAFKGYKMPSDFLTDKGEPSTDVEALKYLIEEYDDKMAALVLRFRELTKLLGTYVDGILSRRDEEDVIHCTYRQLGAKTGRLSSANPNMQNAPRRSDTMDIRHAFVPREGYVFIDADYSQIEPRLVAYISNDPQMLKVYADGGDIHAMVAAAIGSDRQTGKTLGLATLYGLSAYSLGRKLKIEKEAAQRLISNYFDGFPAVRDFIERAKQEMRTTYAVRSILGRKRRFPEYPAAKASGDEGALGRIERMAVNAVVQASAADLMKLALRNMPAALAPLGGQMLLTVHDELIIEIPEGRAEEALAVVKEVMEGVIDLGTIGMKVAPKVMTRWEK